VVAELAELGVKTEKLDDDCSAQLGKPSSTFNPASSLGPSIRQFAPSLA
jgi:hypothetical protein